MSFPLLIIWLINFEFICFEIKNCFLLCIKNIFVYFASDFKRWHLVREGRKERKQQLSLGIYLHLDYVGIRWVCSSHYGVVHLFDGPGLWSQASTCCVLMLGAEMRACPGFVVRLVTFIAFLARPMVTYALDNEWICR